MATQKKPAKAKTQIKLKDLKARKDAKGGGVTNTGTGGSNLGSGGGKASS